MYVYAYGRQRDWISECDGLQQESSNEAQRLLLQYVIFPYGDVLHSELWVEPQYGEVCDTPPGLDYLKSHTHADISTKVMFVCTG